MATTNTGLKRLNKFIVLVPVGRQENLDSGSGRRKISRARGAAGMVVARASQCVGRVTIPHSGGALQGAMVYSRRGWPYWSSSGRP